MAMSKQVMAIQGQVMARDLARQPTKASAPDWDLVAGPRPLSRGTADKSTANPGTLSADGVTECQEQILEPDSLHLNPGFTN